MGTDKGLHATATVALSVLLGQEVRCRPGKGHAQTHCSYSLVLFKTPKKSDHPLKKPKEIGSNKRNSSSHMHVVVVHVCTPIKLRISFDGGETELRFRF
jgi:hypothetical protein